MNAVDTSPPSPARGGDRLPMAGLLALAATGFLTMLTEIVPAGLLSPIGTSLHTQPARTGQLLTAYAIGSMIAAIPLTALARSLPRRPLLLGTLLIVAAVNGVTAISSAYWLTLAVRVVGGVAAGVQWAMIAAYAMRLVNEDRKGRALAVSMAGVPLALAFGLPAGTGLGDLIGWRGTFAAMAALALLVVAWARIAIPGLPGEAAEHRLSVRRVLLLPGLPAIFIAAFAFEVGHMNLYTYIDPMLHHAGLGGHVGALLLVFGVSALVGLWAAGALLDRHPRSLVLTVLTGFVLAMLVFATASRMEGLVAAAAVVWGLALGAAPTMFQAASARAAGAAMDVAQAILVTVLNAGMAVGGALGGATLSAGTPTLGWVSAAIFAAALGVAAYARRSAFPSALAPTRVTSDQSQKEPVRAQVV